MITGFDFQPALPLLLLQRTSATGEGVLEGTGERSLAFAYTRQQLGEGALKRIRVWGGRGA